MLIKKWTADNILGSSDPVAQTFVIDTVRNVQLETYQAIGLRGIKEGDEPAPLDYIEISPIIGDLPEEIEIYLEAESGDIGTGWTKVDDVTASGGQYIAYLGSSTDNQDTPPDNPEEISTYTVGAESGSYKLWIRMRHPDGGKDDSFWIRMNEGDWIKWNGIANDLPDDIFLWIDYGADFNLDTGNNKLEIGYRETDARLDMICLASQGVTPDISVSPAGGLSVMTESFELFQNYPNPFYQNTIIRFNIPYPELVTLKIYNLFAQKVAVLINESIPAGTHEVVFHPASDFSPGFYIYSIKSGKFVSSKRMLLTR